MKKIMLAVIILLALIINAGCKIVITPHAFTETTESTAEAKESSTTKKSSSAKKSSADHSTSAKEADGESAGGGDADDQERDETTTRRPPPPDDEPASEESKPTEKKTTAASSATRAQTTTASEKETTGENRKTTTEKQRESKQDNTNGEKPDPTGERPDPSNGERPTREGGSEQDPTGEGPDPSNGERPTREGETKQDQTGGDRPTRRAGEETGMYELGADSVPSLPGIVGERTRPSYGTSTGNYQGVPCKIYDFEYLSDTVLEDLEQYVNTLRFDYGYMLLTDMDLTAKSGFVSIAIESAEPGMLIILDIEWDQRGYKLSFYIVEGTLTLNE